MLVAQPCLQLLLNVLTLKLMYDLNKERISDWNSDNLDKLPIYEPSLVEIIKL